ncbi:MAG: DUF433 domain-containing protein [Planctomycetes bacterium]|nr:DUF433 domain-containing protein [Planctomycetota bacterium]
MEIAPGIEINENVKFGKPVIKGTRVPVDIIVGKLAGGMSYEEVMEEYDLELRDILSALKYAADLIGDEEIRVTVLK